MAEVKPKVKRKISVSDTLKSHKVGEFTTFHIVYYTAAVSAANHLKSKGCGKWSVLKSNDGKSFTITREE